MQTRALRRAQSRTAEEPFGGRDGFASGRDIDPRTVAQYKQKRGLIGPLLHTQCIMGHFGGRSNFTKGPPARALLKMTGRKAFLSL